MKKWDKKDFDECLFLSSFIATKDLQLENELLITIWMNTVAKAIKEKNQLESDHYSYNFLNMNKRTLMEMLDVKRYTFDLSLRYLEGGQLIKIGRPNEMTFTLTNVGNQYMSAFIKTPEGNQMWKQMIRSC